MDVPTPVLVPTQGQSSSFLLMPAEIRNEVYQYLLPDVTSLRDVTGLLSACKQIRQEFSSMIVAESQLVMNGAVQKSIDMVQVAFSTTEINTVIGTPQIQTHSHLHNVKVRLGMRDTRSLPADANEPRIYFDDVFASFRELLGLHLPYVTVNVPAAIAKDASIADPELRHRLLDACIFTFRGLEETPGVTLNVQHVIFKIQTHKWDTAALIHEPVVVFVRRINEQKEIKFDLLWKDPRTESQQNSTDMAMMAQLKDIDGTNRLLQLPGEIRNTIYEYALTANHHELFYRDSIDFDTIPQAVTEEVNSIDDIWHATPQECVDAYYEHESAQGVKLCSTAESTSEFNQLKYVCKQLYKETKHLSLLYNDIVFAQDNFAPKMNEWMSEASS
ncbi:uncharacterized protein J4E88_001491 [Alternaria novae-zelandiae]|uniref:uncharacterized protein n=1 Tax=Alternaria novae-zelandiae TaxID=430562 RepID=UPI0020C36D22|nr:uncharacterized protein J4E88_001491 [Alternaria novae-zelandiae]KAI4693120.1 hypothetical protein J4E88_001491 [Alternaria novae-zelandiae]